MPDAKDLGKLVAVHGIAPAYLQRAVFIVVLSFAFFLAMMLGFYIRQSIGYFLLASAFLMLYLVTMFSWVMQRRSHVAIFEHGLTYKKNRVAWTEITDVSSTGVIKFVDGKQLTVPKSIHDFDAVIRIVRGKLD